MSPARERARARSTKARSGKRAVKRAKASRRPGAQVAPKRAKASQRPAAQVAPKRAKASRRPAAQAGAKRPRRVEPKARPRKRKPRVAPVPAFLQRAGASNKQLVLFDLLRSGAAVLAALQGLVSASGEQRLGENQWSVREIVLHLVARDRARLREMEAGLRGVPASWAGVSPEEMDRINAADLAPLLHLGWDEARSLLHTTRHQLIEVVEGVPDEPSEVWSPQHPFGWMLHVLPPHDLHHADILKRWRAERGV